ncbi:hypothetical protein MUCCIDRAFT_120404, partial [Mucor lusitanicus CBS 277.49]
PTKEEISTIFVVGFPEDMQEREFQNMFMFSPGFEAATLKVPSKDGEDDYMIGFAKFRTRKEAMDARDILNGRKVDAEKGSMLKAEMAKKNLHTKRVMEENNNFYQQQQQLHHHHHEPIITRFHPLNSLSTPPKSSSPPPPPGILSPTTSYRSLGGMLVGSSNPADQNPPCNTLYVGNLPPNTNEDELRSMFSKCPGYKRLSFRNKSNGPMCFVEFDDAIYAAQALQDLHGNPLSNSVKGGIRLSFSKNP